MNEKHTPGPWVYQISNLGSAHEQGLIFPEKDGPCVAVSNEAKDARLIAAAPENLTSNMELVDLLEELISPLAAGENIRIDGKLGCVAYSIDVAMEKIIRAKGAIKKALGE